ncbi:MAG: exodeoxyribonuclease VII large subunit [Planctomycetota bacterium]
MASLFDDLSQSDPKPIGVSELTFHIKAILEATFESLLVAGEVSDVTVARSGHIYFTLKDDSAQMRGIIWRGSASRMKQPLKAGQAVVCRGRVEVYAARGQYQLIVDEVHPQGLGTLQQRFERLKAKLNQEGLFDAANKRPIDSMPKRIAVITSPTGAAVRDFLRAAQERFRGVDLIVIPAKMQGDGSAASVADAFRMAAGLSPRMDTIVVTRGGGSLEDLWTFNEEATVRAVAECPIPVVSAIGHEIDVTLCDLAADLRALTPTDAASRVLPDDELMRGRVKSASELLQRAMNRRLVDARERLQVLEASQVFRRPMDALHDRVRLLDELDSRATRAIANRLALSNAQVAKLQAALVALSPLDVLSRGYSVTMDESGKVIRNASDVEIDQVLSTRFHQGAIKVTVAESEVKAAE